MSQDTKFVLERCQHGSEPDESRVCDGEAGRGIYAYVPSNAMRAYYTANGETCYRLRMKCGDVADLSKGHNLRDLVDFAKAEFAEIAKQIPGYQIPQVTASNIQRFGRVIEKFVAQRFCSPDVYLVPHKGPGIPSGVQAIIRDISAFEIEPLNREVIATQKTKARASVPGF